MLLYDRSDVSFLFERGGLDRGGRDRNTPEGSGVWMDPKFNYVCLVKEACHSANATATPECLGVSY
jgi:hypothetical protein